MNKNQVNKENFTTFYVVPKPEEVDSELLTSGIDTTDAVINYDEFKQIFRFGEKSANSKSTGPLQDYQKLKDEHLRSKTLFCDDNFTPENIEMSKANGEIVWKRPSEIVQNSEPEWIVDGATRFDIDQGLLGDCWFLAAVANLTINQELFSMVVPKGQSFKQDYAGIFHFRFWEDGHWVDVVIDDRLPTINNKLIYLRSSEPNEFWSPLLEKAYAKFYGSYKKLEGGQIIEALEDLCGGLSEFYEANHPQIYEIMRISYERSSFMGCSIASSVIEGKRVDGLITSHAYSVTALKTIKMGETEVKLLRLRNPWGNDAEWTGKWSDNSEYWNLVPADLRNKLRVKSDDGEFWMQLEDFQKCFTYVDICHLNPSTFLYNKGDNKDWIVSMFEGFFCNNRQYHLAIRGNNSESMYTMVIGLMQRCRRALGKRELPLEIKIYRVKTMKRGQVTKRFFQDSDLVFHQHDENGLRQLTVRVTLPIGKYCIIPSTTSSDLNASYLLRIYSETAANVVSFDKLPL